MALVNLGDFKNEFVVRMQTSTTVAFYTDTILADWANDAYKFSAAYKKWPMTERRDNTSIGVWSSGTEQYSYPSDFRSDAIRILYIGGNPGEASTRRLQKTNFEDYLLYRELNNTGSDKIFSDHGRVLYINPNITGVSGTVTVWGQYVPAIMDRSDPTATTVFSTNDEDANEAIVEEMISYAHMREKKSNEAEYHHQRAIKVLDLVWDQIKNEQYEYQTKDRGMWKRFDVLSGVLREELLKRDQFPLI